MDVRKEEASGEASAAAPPAGMGAASKEASSLALRDAIALRLLERRIAPPGRTRKAGRHGCGVPACRRRDRLVAPAAWHEAPLDLCLWVHCTPLRLHSGRRWMPIAVDARGRQHSVSKAPVDAGANCWVHVSCVDRHVEECAVQEALLSAASPWSPRACEVACFHDAPPFCERRPRDQGKCNQGWALLQLPNEEAAAACAAALHGLRLVSQTRLAVAPARSRVQLSQRRQSQADAAAAVAAAARERSRLHNQRQRLRRREQNVAELQRYIGCLPPPGGHAAASAFTALDQVVRSLRLVPLDWACVPASCRPEHVLGSEATGPAPASSTPAAQEARLQRKRLQVESFALLLRLLLAASPHSQPPHVVDFGCGSGGLLLPLAALFPECRFAGADLDPEAITILLARARSAGLRNVTGVATRIEDYQGPLDVALGLHACGNASDYVIAQALAHDGAYLVCPCCVGKLKFSLAGGSSYSSHAGPAGAAGLPALRHPRSAWMQQPLTASGCDPEAAFAALAAAADVSHGEEVEPQGLRAHHVATARLSKLNLELDRSQAAREAGYATASLLLLQPRVQAKNALLLGAPQARTDWARLVLSLAAHEPTAGPFSL